MAQNNVDPSKESEYSIFYNLYKDDNHTLPRSSSVFGLSKDGEVFFQFLVQGVGITLLAMFGVVGNVFSIIILSKKKMRSPISCFLCGLAVADATFATLATLVVGLPSFLGYIADMGDFGIGVPSKSSLVKLTPIFYGLGVTSLTASSYFTVAVTVERYIAVCHPFKARSLLTYNRARLAAIGVMVFAVVYIAPRWFEYEVQDIFDPVTHELVAYRPVPSKLRMNRTYDVYYVYLGYTLLNIAFPICTLSFLNIQIYRAVRRANRQRQTLSSSQRQENSLALMLLVIVSITIFCNILPMFEVIQKKLMAKPDTLLEVECIRNFLAVFNSSINFVIYCFMAEKFRLVFLEMWPKWVQRYLCCICPVSSNMFVWNRSTFTDSKLPLSKCDRLSFSSSTNTLQDVSLNGVFIAHI